MQHLQSLSAGQMKTGVHVYLKACAREKCPSHVQRRWEKHDRQGVPGRSATCLHEKPMMSTEAGTACVLKLPYSAAIVVCTAHMHAQHS
jgi:hypothetical protein